MSFNPTFATVLNEGCNLYYWFQGSGPLLIFIPGGNGHGRQYNSIMPYLSKHYTVATFDRRQMSNSQVAHNVPLNMAQQARDVIAIIKVLGFEKASVFGNSAGAVFAFQMAVSYPQYLDHVVAHEGPTLALLPDVAELMDWFAMLDAIYRRKGAESAFAEFGKKMVGMDDGLPRQHQEPENGVNFLENEIRLSFMCPDLRRIVKNGVSIALAAGIKSKDAFYVRTTFEQQEILGCERFIVPGHHQGFDTEPEAFSKALLEILDGLEKKRAAKLAQGKAQETTAQ